MADMEDWLLPMLSGVKSAEDWKKFDLLPALRARLDWAQTQELDRRAPGSFETPLGRKVPIDYSAAVPEISVRLQEVFGVTRHPAIGGQPLKITLLSPAQRPIQITRDLPGFWAGSYADVRKDMRAQYPKHPWPEDPTQADPTLRAKRRRGIEPSEKSRALSKNPRNSTRKTLKNGPKLEGLIETHHLPLLSHINFEGIE